MLVPTTYFIFLFLNLISIEICLNIFQFKCEYAPVTSVVISLQLCNYLICTINSYSSRTTLLPCIAQEQGVLNLSKKMVFTLVGNQSLISMDVTRLELNKIWQEEFPDSGTALFTETAGLA